MADESLIFAGEAETPVAAGKNAAPIASDEEILSIDLSEEALEQEDEDREATPEEILLEEEAGEAEGDATLQDLPSEEPSEPGVQASSPSPAVKPAVAAETLTPEASFAPATTAASEAVGAEQTEMNRKLLAYAAEVSRIFAQIEKLKSSAASREDWETILIFIAVQKSRVTHMRAAAKGIYVKLYGDRFEELSREKMGLEKVKTLAARDVYAEYMLYRRIEISWQDMQDLLWTVKMVADNITDDSTAPKFDEIPEELFNRPVDEL
jgi:hypothetical protein